MDKKYSEDLLIKIKEKQYVEDINGVNVIMKPIPDCDDAGMMDTRLYHDSKKNGDNDAFYAKEPNENGCFT